MKPNFEVLSGANHPNAICQVGAYVRTPTHPSLGVGRVLSSLIKVIYPNGEWVEFGGNCVVLSELNDLTVQVVESFEHFYDCYPADERDEVTGPLKEAFAAMKAWKKRHRT